MKPEPIAPFREDRQYGEPYADNEQVYRTIGLTSAQLGRLPKWATLAIARADASLIRRDKTIADLLAELTALTVAVRAAWDTPEVIRNDWFMRRLTAAETAIAKATGDA